MTKQPDRGQQTSYISGNQLDEAIMTISSRIIIVSSYFASLALRQGCTDHCVNTATKRIGSIAEA